MGLLAIVAVGVFGVVLSISRKSNEPSVREDVAFAVEKARDELQRYAFLLDSEITIDVTTLNPPLPAGICAATSPDITPLSTGVEHNIACMLPPVCDPDNSSFTYNVELQTNPWWNESDWALEEIGTPYVMSKDMISFYGDPDGDGSYDPSWNMARGKRITFTVTCNGYKL